MDNRLLLLGGEEVGMGILFVGEVVRGALEEGERAVGDDDSGEETVVVEEKEGDNVELREAGE